MQISNQPHAATKCIKKKHAEMVVRFRTRPNLIIGKKSFDHGMIVGARQGGLSISETTDLLGFSRVYREWGKTHLVSCIFVVILATIAFLRGIRRLSVFSLDSRFLIACGVCSCVCHHEDQSGANKS